MSKSVIAEQHPRLMQNNADRPKIRVHHKRKFREITSLPTISIHNLDSLLIFRKSTHFQENLQNDHLRENALIFYHIFSTNSLRKCVEIGLKNL